MCHHERWEDFHSHSFPSLPFESWISTNNNLTQCCVTASWKETEETFEISQVKALTWTHSNFLTFSVFLRIAYFVCFIIHLRLSVEWHRNKRKRIFLVKYVLSMEITSLCHWWCSHWIWNEKTFQSLNWAIINIIKILWLTFMLIFTWTVHLSMHFSFFS